MNVFKSEIEWRSDIDTAPKDKRILLIAIPIIPSHVSEVPEIVVGHWYDGPQKWVIADTLGEPRKLPRLSLKPLFWADSGELPLGVTPRPLDVGDFKG